MRIEWVGDLCTWKNTSRSGVKANNESGKASLKRKPRSIKTVKGIIKWIKGSIILLFLLPFPFLLPF